MRTSRIAETRDDCMIDDGDAAVGCWFLDGVVLAELLYPYEIRHDGTGQVWCGLQSGLVRWRPHRVTPGLAPRLSWAGLRVGVRANVV